MPDEEYDSGNGSDVDDVASGVDICGSEDSAVSDHGVRCNWLLCLVELLITLDCFRE